MAKVEVPWVDGTVREVEEDTLLLDKDSDIIVAKKDGYTLYSPSESYEHPWDSPYLGSNKATALVEVKDDLPPEKVKVPKTPGSIIRGSSGEFYVLVPDRFEKTVWVCCWNSELSKISYHEMHDLLRDGVTQFVFEAPELDVWGSSM